MVNTIVDGTFRQTNLTNESSEYLAKREGLRLAEIELMRQRERVAELRRHLPQGAPIQDYAFEEGPRDLNGGDAPVRTVRLSELFTKPNRSLVIYHLMYGKRQTKACPMCTAWLDGANGMAHHLAQNLDFAVVAAADRPAGSHLALHGPYPARPRQLVHQSRLRHKSPGRLQVGSSRTLGASFRPSGSLPLQYRRLNCRHTLLLPRPPSHELKPISRHC